MVFTQQGDYLIMHVTLLKTEQRNMSQRIRFWDTKTNNAAVQIKPNSVSKMASQNSVAKHKQITNGIAKAVTNLYGPK